MNMAEKVESWGDHHHPKWMDILRIALGIVILMKGVTFLGDLDSVQKMMQIGHLEIFAWFGIHYVAFAHLVGGVMIIAGLLTRLCVAIQIPILLGAVFFVNITKGLTPMNSELWFSVLVLIMLIVFLIVGSGPFSLDAWMRTHKDR